MIFQALLNIKKLAFPHSLEEVTLMLIPECGHFIPRLHEKFRMIQQSRHLYQVVLKGKNCVLKYLQIPFVSLQTSIHQLFWRNASVT